MFKDAGSVPRTAGMLDNAYSSRQVLNTSQGTRSHRKVEFKGANPVNNGPVRATYDLL